MSDWRAASAAPRGDRFTTVLRRKEDIQAKAMNMAQKQAKNWEERQGKGPDNDKDKDMPDANGAEARSFGIVLVLIFLRRSCTYFSHFFQTECAWLADILKNYSPVLEYQL